MEIRYNTCKVNYNIWYRQVTTKIIYKNNRYRCGSIQGRPHIGVRSNDFGDAPSYYILEKGPYSPPFIPCEVSLDEIHE